MEEKLKNTDSAEIIVDDLVVWGRKEERNEKCFEQVWEHALKSGLNLNCKNCKLNINRITYVGHILSSNSLRPNPKLVEAIVDMPEPYNKEELATLSPLMYRGLRRPTTVFWT